MYIFEDDTVYIIIRRTCQWNTSHDFQFSLHVSLSNSFCFSLQMNLEGRFSEKINGITMKATNVNNLFFWLDEVYSCILVKMWAHFAAFEKTYLILKQKTVDTPKRSLRFNENGAEERLEKTLIITKATWNKIACAT